jgi:trans-aconitate 2-methyltransferase
MTSTTNHYTFGETHIAAQRLALLAAAYQAASEAFLATWGPCRPEHAIDLGCGLGYTTRLLHRALRPHRTTGVDASPRFLADAQRASGQDIGFVCHDVTQEPFPIPPADVFFCRFLLTHLHDPGTALRAWAAAARPGARLLVQETAWLRADHPIIARYYELVAALQAGYGQSLEIGADLDASVRSRGWKILSSRLAVVQQPAVVMARLHAMNMRTWGRDRLVQGSFDLDEVARIQAGLDRIASGEQPAHPVSNALRELVAVAE